MIAPRLSAPTSIAQRAPSCGPEPTAMCHHGDAAAARKGLSIRTTRFGHSTAPSLTCIMPSHTVMSPYLHPKQEKLATGSKVDPNTSSFRTRCCCMRRVAAAWRARTSATHFWNPKSAQLRYWTSRNAVILSCGPAATSTWSAAAAARQEIVQMASHIRSRLTPILGGPCTGPSRYLKMTQPRRRKPLKTQP